MNTLIIILTTILISFIIYRFCFKYMSFISKVTCPLPIVLLIMTLPIFNIFFAFIMFFSFTLPNILGHEAITDEIFIELCDHTYIKKINIVHKIFFIEEIRKEDKGENN